MNENIRLFFEKYADDKELQNKLAAIQDPDEAFALVQSVQDGFTKEEFFSFIEQLNDNENRELDLEDMAKVAGGASGSLLSFVSEKVMSILSLDPQTATATVTDNQPLSMMSAIDKWVR